MSLWRAWTAATLALAACAPLPPHQPLPAPRLPAALGLSEAVATPRPAAEWWREFGDPALDAWVGRALADQPTLAVTAARTARAAAAVAAQRSAARPRLGFEADAGSQRYSEHGIVPPPIAGSVRDSFAVQFAGSWEVDFFGRHRAALAAALGHERALAAEQQAARTLLAAQVVRAWVALARLGEERALAERQLALRTTALSLVRQREAAGLDSRVELRQAEGAQAEARRQLEALDEQATLARHALAALAAQPVAGETQRAPLQPGPALGPGLTPLRTPALPAHLGADLLGRRADVAAARWRVEAATHEVALARLSYLPDLDLTAFAGLASLGLSRLIDVGSRQFGANAALRLPIFEGGRLDAALDARRAEHAAAVAVYDATVIDAVREAADALASVRSLERQAAEQARALAAAVGAWTSAAERHRAGVGGALPVLALEGAHLGQRRAAIDLHARRLDAHAQLMRALGGGYDTAAAGVPSASSIRATIEATAVAPTSPAAPAAPAVPTMPAVPTVPTKAPAKTLTEAPAHRP